MIVTTLEGYALKAMLYISLKKEKRATVKEISKENKISFPYILRICSLLRNNGLLISTKGRKGGYILAKDPKKITLYEIINSVGRTSIEIKCDFGIRKELHCFQKDCISLDAWLFVLDKADMLFKQITLFDLLERSRKDGDSTNASN